MSVWRVKGEWRESGLSERGGREEGERRGQEWRIGSERERESGAIDRGARERERGREREWRESEVIESDENGVNEREG